MSNHDDCIRNARPAVPNVDHEFFYIGDPADEPEVLTTDCDHTVAEKVAAFTQFAQDNGVKVTNLQCCEKRKS